VRRFAWLLVFSLAAISRPASAWLGPKVDLDGKALTFEQACDAVGRQIGVHFNLPWNRPAQPPPTYAFHLHGVSPQEAVTALATTCGQHLQRVWRFAYALAPPADLLPAPVLGRPLEAPFEDWTVWARDVTAVFNAAVTTRAGDSMGRITVTPSFVIQAPSDAELLRLVRVKPCDAESESGATLECPRYPETWNRDYADPSRWLLAPALGPIEHRVKRLARCGFDMVYFDLAERVFDFGPLDGARGDWQTDGEIDARLEARPAPGQPWPVALKVSTPPGEIGGWMNAVQRPGTFTARFFDAHDKPLYTRLDQAVDRPPAPRGGEWLVKLNLSVVEPDTRLAPRRLEVRAYLPQGGPAVRHVEFRDLPVPDVS
jgi:hypothetical protein